MSHKRSASRRLSLLAGSSLVAAGLSAFAMTGVVLTPGAAYAYDECAPADPPTTLTDGADGVSDPTLNGATADSFTCAVTPYATGITYSSSGNLTVTSTNAAETTITANGVNLAGNGADSVTWDSSAGSLTGGAGTAGPVIDVTSVSGAIGITTGAVTGSQAGTTNAIRATSTGAGDITITSGSVSNTADGAQAAIAAVTNGGDIDISPFSASGRLRGILAQTSGAGSVTLTLTYSASASSVDGIAAIDATAGTGGLTIDVGSSLDGGSGLAIRGASTGGVVVTNSGQIGSASFNTPVGGGDVDFSGVTAGGVSLTHAGLSTVSGRWMVTGASTFSSGNDTVTFAGIGISRAIGGASFAMLGGNDTWNLAATLGVIDTSLDFGAGADVFNVSGVLSASDVLEITGLEALNNSGVIYLGAYAPPDYAGNPREDLVDYSKTDGYADDKLMAHGATFTGSGASRIVLDAYLDGRAQNGCETLTGAADCVDLRDGSTAGVTLVTVNDLAEEAAHGGFSSATIVDVSGSGSSAGGHFVLDPNSDGYTIDPIFGPVIARAGLFAYALHYDAENQWHALAGVPRSQTMEYAMLGGAATSIWHMTSDTVTDRQTDLRAGTEGGTVWVRATGEYSERDVSTEVDVLGDVFAFDNSYKLYAGTIMGGMDLVSGRSGGYDYVLGAQIGYVGSSFDLNASESSGRMTGATGGVYASAWSEAYFVDAALNANVLTLDYDSPGLGAKTNTYLNSLGARVEGGMRIGLTERSFVEPLATIAYVRTSFEELSLAGGEVTPSDTESLRAALGARLGATLSGGGANVTWFVAGRAWNEFEGASDGVVNNPGSDLPFSDEFSGGFGEAEAGINVFNDAGTLSGFLTSGIKKKSGYSAVNLALGMRMAW